MLLQGIFRILTPLSLLSWGSESFRQDIGQFHYPRMKPCSGKFFLIKNILIMKNLTDFCKMVETGVDPRLK